MSLARFGGEQYLGCIETLARIRLAQGDLDGCAEYLDQVESTTASGIARAGFVRRHAQLTLAALWEQSGRLKSIHRSFPVCN